MSEAALTASGRRRLDVWKIAYAVILVLALVTRLYALGDRAVSHDETTHAKYSWNLYSGRGFRHDPLMHGPLLFEATALLYALFGVSDFTARLYTALAGVALVMAPWLLRRWLGRLGAVLASLMLLISPSITYYSRYTRHDVPTLLAAMLLLWAVLRYVADGRARWLRWAAAFFALLYASKEVAYIYTAIFMGLMALPLLWQVLRTRWRRPQLIPVLVGLLILALIAGAVFASSLPEAMVIEEGEGNTAIGDTVIPAYGRIAVGLAALALLALLILLARAVGEGEIRSLRMFDVLMVLGTLTLPLGSALLMRFVAGVDMSAFYPALMAMDFSAIPLPMAMGAFAVLGVSFVLSVGLGLWWDAKRWPFIALVGYAVFIVFYSTIFTYGWGVVTGFVGGLAYWMAQQRVDRGNQPWYYYGLIGPLYEYLPILISFLGGATLVGRALVRGIAQLRSSGTTEDRSDVPSPMLGELLPRLLPFFFMGWAGLSWIAYAIAGEKMPWLFVHIALPHILLAAWVLGRIFEGLSWRRLFADRGWWVPVSLLFLGFAWGAFRESSGSLQQVLEQSGAAQQLALTVVQLQPLARLTGGLIGILIFSGLLIAALDRVGARRGLRLVAASAVAFTGVLTVRTMIMLNYVNDELATEYMVYAHSTPDVNHVLSQIEELSWRLTGTPDQIKVAYGQHVAWPFYWYMDTRYPNNYYFTTPEPERLLECPVIIAEKDEWPAVEEIVSGQYDSFDYKHIWWPVEDYKDLSWERIKAVLTDPERRQAIWDIIWNRDYTRYARLRNPEDPFTLHTWPHRLEFRFYVRKDVTDLVWDYQLEEGRAVPGAAVGGASPDEAHDLYADVRLAVSPTVVADLPNAEPQGIAVAPDGSFYVTDTATHRIWHVSAEGAIIGAWGGYGVGPGEFHTPWAVAVDAQGFVYVADTWNHRIQKFDAEGNYLLSWGRLAEVEPFDVTGQGGFFGPRGIAVASRDGEAETDPVAEVYVADTGNHRIQVFDTDGRYLREFGGAGDWPGALREPAGIAVGATGNLYVADTWHRRIQVLSPEELFLREWEVPVWGAIDDRPQLAAAPGAIIATDAAYQRVVVFDTDGMPLQALDDASSSVRPGGVAWAEGRIYVTDRAGSRIVSYPWTTGP
ncbi:MAG: flippase activity-associated protein Agl23 [Anaerolineae bacterium]